MDLSIDERSAKKEEFYHELLQLYQLMTFERSDSEKINLQFEKTLALLSHFPMDMLPYSAASKFIYEINDDDVEYFFQYLEEMLMDRFKDLKSEEVYKKAVKLIEHLDLATSQKAYLFQKQERQLSELVKKFSDVNDALKQYETSKTEIEKSLVEFSDFKNEFNEYVEHLDEFGEKLHGFEEKFENFRNEYREFDNKFKKVEKSTEQITVNLISILGIFAAILLGAYGSIQGFSNIFANASSMKLGKVLIISSIGGSAVLLILFFLLSSIARMTERKFGQVDKVNFMDKHPIMFYSHAILIIIFLFGLVIEAISKNMKPDLYWLWLIIPLLAVIQVCCMHYTRSIWGVFRSLKNMRPTTREIVLFFICVILAITVLAFSFEYI